MLLKSCPQQGESIVFEFCISLYSFSFFLFLCPSLAAHGCLNVHWPTHNFSSALPLKARLRAPPSTLPEARAPGPYRSAACRFGSVVVLLLRSTELRCACLSQCLAIAATSLLCYALHSHDSSDRCQRSCQSRSRCCQEVGLLCISVFKS